MPLPCFLKVEEEEYTTRIIHHFSTGLLTLPEGATLRSFLADKLNCDPMRITKKFAGASCLGRRVFHLRNRPQPSYEEIQMARNELDQLDQRFRLRVEHGYGGMPLTTPPGMMLKFATPAEATPAPSAVMSQPVPVVAQPVQTPSHNAATAAAATAAATTFLQNFAVAAAAAAATAGANGGAAPTASFPFLTTPAAAQVPAPVGMPPLASLSGAPGAPQWLLPAPANAPAPVATAPA